MPKSILDIQNLSHAYGQRQALQDVSLAIAPGEIFGFLGPNGSGKTTLFRILATLVPPQTGQVLFHLPGQEAPWRLPADRDDVRRHIGVVFQSPSLDIELSAEENLRHQGHLYGLRGSELKQRIEQLLTRVGLADRRRERVKQFSGGMRRRVELAKGLLHRPSLLLLDEPSTGLDVAARIDLWRYLREIRDTDSATILVTTHLMDEADQCHRLAIMDRGQVRACDAPAALKERIGGDIITLTSPRPDELRQAIRQRFDIEPEQIDHTLRIERPRGHEFVPQLIEAFPGLIDAVSVGKPTLEDVFIHVTGHGLHNHAET
jgi:ABC-2 type transport system ATP-binding protein